MIVGAVGALDKPCHLPEIPFQISESQPEPSSSVVLSEVVVELIVLTGSFL